MRKNWHLVTLNTLAVGKVLYGHVFQDGVMLGDLYSIGMATLLFWLGRDIYYSVRGALGLNSGATGLHKEAPWEKKHKIWEEE